MGAAAATHCVNRWAQHWTTRLHWRCPSLVGSTCIAPLVHPMLELASPSVRLGGSRRTGAWAAAARENATFVTRRHRAFGGLGGPRKGRPTQCSHWRRCGRRDNGIIRCGWAHCDWRWGEKSPKMGRACPPRLGLSGVAQAGALRSGVAVMFTEPPSPEPMMSACSSMAKSQASYSQPCPAKQAVARGSAEQPIAQRWQLCLLCRGHHGHRAFRWPRPDSRWRVSGTSRRCVAFCLVCVHACAQRLDEWGIHSRRRA